MIGIIIIHNIAVNDEPHFLLTVLVAKKVFPWALSYAHSLLPVAVLKQEVVEHEVVY